MPGQNALRCECLCQTVDAVPPEFKHVLRFRQTFDLSKILLPPACEGFLKRSVFCLQAGGGFDGGFDLVFGGDGWGECGAGWAFLPVVAFCFGWG